MRLILGVIAVLLMAFPVSAQIAVKGKTVYTMAGDPIQDGVVLFKDGKIERVGPASSVTIPSGYKVFEGAVVTPGLIDAHTVVGLAGYLNQDGDQEQLEESSPIQPELRAIDSYNAREYLVGWLREHGVTTIHTGHGPGAPVSGQTLVAKTQGDTVDQAVIKPQAMLALTFAGSALSDGKKPPGTRAKMMAMLRGQLIKAGEYREKQEKAEEGKEPGRNLGLEVLVKVLDGELPVLITANRAHDILSAIRLAQEFNLKMVLDSGAEAFIVLDEIKQAGIPIILHPTMKRSRGEAENLSMATASILKKEGIPFAFQSGYEGYVPKTRVILFEAAIAAAHGLAFQDALAGLTIEPAKILGLEDRIGSLEAGKDGDVVIFDGDPFEYLTHVTHVFIDGKLASDKKR